MQNKLRKDPKWLIGYLKKKSERFVGRKLFSHSDSEIQLLKKKLNPSDALTITCVNTNEGVRGYQETISFLQKQTSNIDFKWSSDLENENNEGKEEKDGPKAQKTTEALVFEALTPLEAL